MEAETDFELDPQAELVQRIKDAVDNGAAEIRLYRQRTGETKAKYLCEVDVAAFSLEYVRVTFGGGNYSYRAVDQKGKIITNGKFEIDESWRGTHDRQHNPGQPGAGLPDMPAIIKAIKEGLPAGGGDNAALMMQMMQMQMSQQQESNRMMMQMQQETTKLLVTAMGGNRGGDLNSALLQLALENKGGGSLSESIKAFKELKGLAGDEPAEKTGLLEQLLPAILPALMPLLMQKGLLPGGPAMPPASVTVSPPRTNPPVPAAGPKPEIPALASLPVPQQQEMLRQAILSFWPMLAGGSANGTDPISYGDLICDQLGADLEAVQKLLRRDDWLSLFPADAQKNVEWFRQLRDSVIDDTPEPASDGKSA